jgi:hypothetical protein
VKNRAFPLFFILFICIGASLFAGGKQEEEAEKKIQNNEWILCVTNFDSGSIPESKRIIADVIQRSLVDTLKTISYRIRVSPEYAFYEEYAWARERTAAAKPLSAKQDERALLLYRGETGWKYRQSLARIDSDIEKLKDTLAKAESDVPLINREPTFSIAGTNAEGAFPEPPKARAEYRFCRGQNVDAFLAGSIQEYYNRYYVSLKLYAIYTRSVIYEDNIIFSPDDLPGAVEEISGRLVAALSGSPPAALAVRAEPPETLVLVNRSFAGRGSMETREYPPGKATINLSANDYETETIETELVAGELVEIVADLRPLEYGSVTVFSSGQDSRVYLGSLYVGDAPLTLRLPLNQLEYVSVESAGGEMAKAAFQTPADANTLTSLYLNAAIPSGQRQVNKARSAYYWAWGGTWITGIAAWIAYGAYINSDISIRYGADSGYLYKKYVEENERMYYISMGTAIALGAAVGYEIFRMYRYIHTAGLDETPMVKTGNNE